MRSSNSIETYTYGTSKDLICKKEKIKQNNIIKQQKNIKEHNPNWREISDHTYRILTIGGSEPRKTNALLNLINEEPDIDKIYFYTKDSHQAKCQLLINKRESMGLKYLNNLKSFTNYSNDIDGIYKNIE